MTAAQTPSTPATGEPRTVSLQEAVQIAVDWQQQGRLEEAERVYDQVLALKPDLLEVLNFKGILLHQRGDNEGALKILRQAAQTGEPSRGIWNNLGNVLLHLDQEDEAEAAFRRSVEISDGAAARANLGRILRRKSQWAASEAECRRAIELEADCGVGWHNLSLALLGQQRRVEAIAAAQRAEELMPDMPRRRAQFARGLIQEGELALAADIFRRWIAEEPENPYPRHQLAAVTGEGTPRRAEDLYLQEVFDSFAPTFDTKLASLDYCGPQLAADAAAAALPAPAAQFDVADVGCGTGLCGPLFKPWARRLVGCDLSGNMLERAAQREVYDTLHRQELTAWLQERPGEFDVVVSADTLIYFGDLHEVMRAAAGALRADGRLLFTLEALDDGDPVAGTAGQRLMLHGRYAHTPAHVRSALAAAGLAEVALERHVVRVEGGEPVQGWVVTARKPR